MNSKKAKALRKLITAVHGHRPAHEFKEMTMGFAQGMVTVAADTQRGQYVAMKRIIAKAYSK
jgi:ribosomal protein S7